MSALQFLSAFGLGAVVSALVQAWLSHRAYMNKRRFDEKKEAYTGYLDAMLQSEIKKTDEASLNFGHWHNRIELVGSAAVLKACARIKNTNPLANGPHPDRPAAQKELHEAMRKDLGVAK